MMKQVTILAATAVAMAYGASVLDRKSSDAVPSARPDRGNMQTMKSSSGRIAAISADSNGHFRVSTLVNGVHVDMMADTGATVIALTPDDARRIGIDMDKLVYNAPVATANGTIMNARVRLDEVDVGGIVVRDVLAVVAPEGALGGNLLGMSYIGALSRFELRGNQLVLVE